MSAKSLFVFYLSRAYPLLILFPPLILPFLLWVLDEIWHRAWWPKISLALGA